MLAILVAKVAAFGLIPRLNTLRDSLLLKGSQVFQERRLSYSGGRGRCSSLGEFLVDVSIFNYSGLDPWYAMILLRSGFFERKGGVYEGWGRFATLLEILSL